MREFGEYLKQMREKQGLSIKEVSERTKIRLEYLEALEESILEKLPPEVYIRGYIKAYGELLGADLDELFARYEEAKPKKSKISLFQRSKKPPAPVPKAKILKKHRKKDDDEEKPPRRVVETGGIKTKQVFYALLVVLGIIIIVGVVKIFSNRDPEPEPVNQLIEKTNTDELPISESPLEYADVLQEVILPMRPIDPSWAIGRAESLTIQVRVRQRTWVYIESDYRPVFKGNVEPGVPQTFRAKNAFFLTITKPELVAIEINGFDLVPGEKLREAVGAPPTAGTIDVQITKANITKYLEGYNEIALPVYDPGTAFLDTLGNRSDTARQPQTTQPKPAVRKTTPRRTTQPKTQPTTPTPNPSDPPPLKPRGI